MSYAEIQAIEVIDQAANAREAPCDKWEVLRDLNVARSAFGVTDRDLSVLSALLSFHPTAQLNPDGQPIVFPSNRKLAERAHGMAESTLRRHLGALVKAGLIRRHDSPNGKRYVRRGQGGEIAIAFGFDLTPLRARASEIAHVAAETRAALQRATLLRERTSLRLRDAAKLLELVIDAGFAPEDEMEALAEARRATRRKSSFEEMEALEADLILLLERLNELLSPADTQKMDGTDIQNERHQQNSKPEHLDIEPNLEKVEGGRGEPLIPFQLVIKACPEISLYASGDLRSWRDLQAAATFVRGMLGISESAWNDACSTMGRDVAAIVIACLLERFETIRSPGGYLRALTEQAREGAFSPGPMVMALLSSTPKTEVS